MNAKPLTIFLINCDWRDIFRTAPQELKEKLNRDQLEPGENRFFFLSWSKHWYHAKEGNFETLHLPLHTLLKPIFGDILLLILAPLVMRYYHVRPNVVISYDFGFLPAAKFTAWLSDAKLVMYVNNMPRLYSATRRLGGIKSLYSGILERLWRHLPDAYCTINAYMAQYLEDLGIPRKRIFLYVVNTIAQDKRYIEASRPGQVRQKYGIPKGAPLLLCVARLEPEKDHARLVRLMTSLPQVHLLLVGRGSLEGKIREMAHTVGVDARVHFTGHIGREEIWNYYRDADVFVLLSKAEALGIVFWEAMYMSVPVIGSDVPGIVESLGEKGERGIVLSDDASGEEFARAVAFAITPSPARDATIKRAREYVEVRAGESTTITNVLAKV